MRSIGKDFLDLVPRGLNLAAAALRRYAFAKAHENATCRNGEAAVGGPVDRSEATGASRAIVGLAAEDGHGTVFER